MRVFWSVLLSPALVIAQQGNGVQGAITGNVVCSDTNRPARLATITLQPIQEALFSPDSSSDRQPKVSLNQIETKLDGSFTLPGVSAGKYYLIVQFPGYISPTSLLTRTDVNHLTQAGRELVATFLPVAVVEPGHITRVNVTLHRGAAISGVVRFEDGTPIPRVSVTLSKRNHEGRWITAPGAFTVTDDLGQYHLSGLPSEEYQLSATLVLQENSVNSVFDGTRMISSKPKSSVTIFYGDTFFRSSAKSIKLSEAEDRKGQDITVADSKLHSISGSLVDPSGHVISAGTVVLYAQNAAFAGAAVGAADRTFDLELIPDGQYEVRVSDARDDISQGVNTSDATTGTGVVHSPDTYGKYKSTLMVNGDLTSVVLNIPRKEAASSRTQ